MYIYSITCEINITSSKGYQADSQSTVVMRGHIMYRRQQWCQTTQMYMYLQCAIKCEIDYMHVVNVVNPFLLSLH